jgi:hypothetical protein
MKAWLPLVCVSAGCSSTVTAPPEVVDPVEVFVLEEAMHTGLVLPPDPSASGSPEQYVEFGYGDWSWYARGNDAWYDVFATVLWPTRGTLGRRTFGARTPAELRRRAHWARLSSIVVEREHAAALRVALQRRFDARRKQVVVDRRLGFKFVPTDGAYWLPHNCADVVADWLERLGCEVGWAPLRVGIYVPEPPG